MSYNLEDEIIFGDPWKRSSFWCAARLSKMGPPRRVL